MLKEKYTGIQEMLEANTESHIVNQHLSEIIGSWPENTNTDPDLKDFYYFRLVISGATKDYAKAAYMARLLVQLDPSQMYFRKALEDNFTNMFKQVESAIDKDKANETFLIEFLNNYHDVAIFPYTILTKFCLVMAKTPANRKRARKIISAQLCLNPYDSDYLMAARDVARACGLVEWEQELVDRMQGLKLIRPWDLNLYAMFSKKEAA